MYKNDKKATHCKWSKRYTDAFLLHASGVVVSNVACGSSHVAAVTHDGEVYCWGDNRFGQCGNSASSRVPIPSIVPLRDASPPCRHDKAQPEEVFDEDRGVKVLQCAAGEQHTLVLSDYGELWTWGSGIALGLPNIGSEPVPPTRLDYLQGRRVLAISASARHNLVLIQKLAAPTSAPPTRRSASIDSSTSSASRDSNTLPQQPPPPRYRPATCTKCRIELNKFDELDEVVEDATCPLGLAVRDSQRSSSISALTALGPSSVPNAKFLPSQASLTDVQEGRRSSSSSLRSVSSTSALLQESRRSSSSTLRSVSSASALTQSAGVPNQSTSALGRSAGAPTNSNINAATSKDRSVDTVGNSTTEAQIEMVNDINGLKEVEKTVEKSKSVDETVDKNRPNENVAEHTKSKVENVSKNQQNGQKDKDESKKVETAIDEPITIASTPTDSYNTSISSGSPTTESKDTIELAEVMTTSTGSLRIGGVTKSRSTFLQDEEEAKLYLEKQLSGGEISNASGTSGTSTPPISPLVKTVGNLMSYVPTQQAAAMQVGVNVGASMGRWWSSCGMEMSVTAVRVLSSHTSSCSCLLGVIGDGGPWWSGHKFAII